MAIFFSGTGRNAKYPVFILDSRDPGGLSAPRQLETALTEPSLSAEYDDDTALDPPQIMNLTMFQSYVRKARQVLERYQLTLQHRIPRQLVPVQLEHFTRPDWTTEIGE